MDVAEVELVGDAADDVAVAGAVAAAAGALFVGNAWTVAMLDLPVRTIKSEFDRCIRLSSPLDFSTKMTSSQTIFSRDANLFVSVIGVKATMSSSSSSSSSDTRSMC